MNDLILYTTEDGRSQIKLRAQEQTVWLTQLEMAELFDSTKQNISLHLKNVFKDGELDPAAAVKESLTVQIEGSREVQRPVTLYNLDAILAVGYRVFFAYQSASGTPWKTQSRHANPPAPRPCPCSCSPQSAPFHRGCAERVPFWLKSNWPIMRPS